MYLPAKSAVNGNETYIPELFHVDAAGKVSTVRLTKNYLYRQWRSRKRTSKLIDGWRNPNAYSRTVIYNESLGGSVTDYGEDGVLRTWYGDPGTDSTYHPVSFTGLINMTNGSINRDMSMEYRANTEVLLKVKDSKVNYGEALAEARSTVRHLARTAIDLTRAYSAARKGQWGKVRRILKIDKYHTFKGKNFASRWLELQFAWTPLVSDISGTVDVINEGLRKNGIHFSVVRNLIREGDLPLTQGLFDPSKADTFYTGTTKRTVSVKLYCKIRNEDVANLTSLGLTDPAQVAWALLPFSFLVDWLMPVGSYLEALGATKGVQFISGTRTTLLEYEFECKSRPPFLQSKVTRREGWFTSKHRGKAIDRQVLSSFPRAVPYVKSPFSTSHVISAVALIRALKR